MDRSRTPSSGSSCATSRCHVAGDVITPVETDRYAGIVTFRPLDESVESLFDSLRAAGVACALRGGGVRFSPHYYTPRKKLFAALELVTG